MLILECPHCKDYFMVAENELNCCIFRHAMFKNGAKVDSHESEKNLEHWKQQNLIYGCGKPFKVSKVGDAYKTEICDYI